MYMSNFAPAAENAIKVIEGIAAEKEPIGISELSRKLDINKNMIFRILNSLEACGWVYCEESGDKKYSLTLKPFEVTSRSRNRLTLNNVATPLVYDLWKKTGESTYLGILSDDRVLYLQHFDSTGPIKIAGTVGGLYELYCTAPGKVLLAYSTDEFIEEYAERNFRKNTEHTITEKKVLLEEIERIRQQGYAVDNEEFGNGIICLAAPVFDCTGSVVGTVGCSLSTVEYDRESAVAFLKPLVCEAVTKISGRLGYQFTECSEIRSENR